MLLNILLGWIKLTNKICNFALANQDFSKFSQQCFKNSVTLLLLRGINYFVSANIFLWHDLFVFSDAKFSFEIFQSKECPNSIKPAIENLWQFLMMQIFRVFVLFESKISLDCLRLLRLSVLTWKKETWKIHTF